MFDFLRTIRKIKTLQRLEPDKSWLNSRRAYFEDLAVPKTVSVPRGAFFQMRLARVIIGLVLIVALGGGGLIKSAEAALPDEALYPIKLLSEKFQSFFVIGNENKVNFALKLAETRLSEAAAIGTSTDEAVIVGTIQRAEGNLAKTQTILASDKASFKNLEKTLKELDKFTEQKEKLAEKFADKFPAAFAALKGVDLATVQVEQEANRIVITFATTTPSETTEAVLKLLMDRASTTVARADAKINEVESKITAASSTTSSTAANEASKKLADAKEKLAEANAAFGAKDWKKTIEKANEAYKLAVDAEVKLLVKTDADLNKGTEQIIKLLTQGAGKSGKVPPGLLTAPGIEKKLSGERSNKGDEDEDNNEGRDKIAPVISGVSVGDVSTSSVKITWTTNENTDSRVNYGPSTGYGSTVFNAILGTSHIVVLQNLTASTTYHFQVVSKDAAGNTATSIDRVFTTLAPQPPADATAPVISALAASDTSTSSVKITWTTDEPADSRLSYGLSTSYSTNVSQGSLVTGHAIVLTGLNASTTYHFRVSSKDSSGNVATSTDATFTTLMPPPSDANPPQIFSVAANNIASSSATVSWTTNESSTGAVYYSTVTPVLKGATTTLSVADNTLALNHSLVLSSLNATTTYYFFVEAKDAAMNTASSTELSFTTGE